MLSRTRLGIFALLPVLLGLALSPAEGQITPRYAHTTTLLPNGNVLVIGGLTSDSDAPATYTGDFDMYVTTLAALADFTPPGAVARASHTATMMPDGRVLIVGGVNGGGVLSSIQIYNPNTLSLTNPTNLGTARFNHTANVLPNGKVLIAGGVTMTGAETNICEIFNPANDSIEACGAGGAMGLARADHTATLLPDGRIFVAGGNISNGTDFAVSTEFYDWVADRWTPGPSLIAKRAYHTATMMGNGKVLIAGGYNGKQELGNQGYLRTTEVYDPITDSITPAANMQTRKAHHAALLTGDGKVHLYGGFGNFTTSYMQIQLTMEPGSSVTSLYSGQLATGVIQSASGLNLRIYQWDLSVPASGRIVDGEVRYSSPTINLEDATVYLDEQSTLASLDGIDVDAGTIEDAPIALSNPSGSIIFNRQEVNSEDGIINGTLYLNSSINPGESGLINSANNNNVLTFGINIPMANSNIGGTIQAGSARILSGSINSEAAGWSIALSSGTDFSITGGGSTCATQVLADENGNGYLDCSLQIGGAGAQIRGIVTSSTDTVIASPVTFSNLVAEGFQLRVHYVVSPVNVSGADFDFDISTIILRGMIFSDDEAYSPDQNEWGFGTPGLTRFGHSALLLPNGDAAIYGGRLCASIANCTNQVFSPQNSNIAYILQQGGGVDVSWNSLTDTMSTSRRAHTATVLPDGKVLVAGGANGPDTIKSGEVFDPEEAEVSPWSPTWDMHVGRSHHTATLLPNGTVLVAGGFRSQVSTGATNRCEIYYPKSRTWVPTSSMISSRSYHTATLMPDGNVVVMGGIAESTYLNSVEVYYSTARKWVQLQSMDTPRSEHTATLMHDGFILVTGGVNVLGVLGDVNTSGRRGVEWFDTSTYQWNDGGGGERPVPDTLTTKRHSHTATLLRGGQVLVAGGNDGFGEIGEAEIFDPTSGAAGAWTQTDPGGTGPGRDMIIPRLGHTAQLLPNGKVLITGGFDKYGNAIQMAEGFDVEFTTWQLQGLMNLPRGDHTSVLGQDGNVILIGGYSNPNYLDGAEYQYFTYGADNNTLDPLPRQPQIVRVSSAIINRGDYLTLYGLHFHGEGEASGGGAGSANSHHSHPRLYLQRLDNAGNTAGNASGFMLDLSSSIYYQNENKWENIPTSITVQVPADPDLLPYGWYHLRVAANSQFSDSVILQAGPPRPDQTPGIPFGYLNGASSVTWNWTPMGGTFDGYNVYSATNDVFLSTVSPSAINGQGYVEWVQRGLGPDTSAMIKVAGYTLSGDGGVALSTKAIHTLSSDITSLQGLPQSTTEIEWTWSENSAAYGYNVYSASTSQLTATVGGATYNQTRLSTNTAYGVFVQALTEAGPGNLTDAVTVYTLAAAPLPEYPSITDLSTDTAQVSWQRNDNPDGTYFSFLGERLTAIDELEAPVEPEDTIVFVSSLTDISLYISDLQPNVEYNVKVAAVNGDGVYSAWTDLGSTYTYANPPLLPNITGRTPSTISIRWDANSNSHDTLYQLVASTDGFVMNFSTKIAFADAFTSTSTVLNGLFTGITYDFRVYAMNGFGNITSYSSTQSYTDNGGGPLGSLSVFVKHDAQTTLAGNLGDGTQIELNVFPDTFDEDVTIFISSQTPGNVPCSDHVALSILTIPALQPLIPLQIAVSYAEDGNPGTLQPYSTLGLARYNPFGSRCVPLDSETDPAAQMVYAETNHLSDFQIMQILPQGSVKDVEVFPNPLYPSRAGQGYFTFKVPGLARVRVYTIHGEKVFDESANSSGVLRWDATNVVGRAVASGIYMAVVEYGGDKEIFKLAVVR